MCKLQIKTNLMVNFQISFSVIVIVFFYDATLNPQVMKMVETYMEPQSRMLNLQIKTNICK
jgi:hypothetical protein